MPQSASFTQRSSTGQSPFRVPIRPNFTQELMSSMRSMIGEDIPLNAGCLVPLEIRIPKGCLLSPSPEAAVCGGNVMTSQVRAVNYGGLMTANHRYCAQGVQCVRGESRLLQQVSLGVAKQD